jgi:outer membrane protein
MKCQIKVLSIIALIVASSFQAFAQTKDTVILSLSDVIATTLENNFQIRVSRNEAEIARNNHSLGNAGMLPEVTASGALNRSSQNTDQEFANGTEQSRTGAARKSSNVGVDLSWTLFDGTKMFATYMRLENEAIIGQYELQQQIDNSITICQQLFYRVALEQERLTLFESNVVFSEERVRIVDQKYQVGKESKLSLLQAKVDLNSDRSSLVQQKELLQGQQLLLLQSMGIEPFPFVLDFQFVIDSLLDLESIQSTAFTQNPLLLAQKYKQLSSQNTIQELSRSRLPVIDLNVGYGYSYLQSEAGFLFRNQTYDLSYGLSARVNLFTGMNQQRQIQNATIQAENALLLEEEAEKLIHTQLLTTYASYKNNLELSRLEEENLDVAIENSEIALERFRLGASDALELREAQINAVNAQIRYLQAQYNAKVAEIELGRLAGTITDSN